MAQPYDPYSGVTYFNNKVANAPYLSELGITQEEMERLTQETLAWKFYNGDQWNYKRPGGEPQVTLNYCRAFVDKSVAFLMAKGFTIQVKEEAEDITKPFLDWVWQDNNKELLGLDIAQMGGISGNAYVKVASEEYDPEEDPDLYELYPQGRIRLLLLPPGSVFPKWYGHDRDRMVECRIIYKVNIEDGLKVREAVYKEILTKKSIKIYLDGELLEERENPIGEIPVVRIKNISQAGDSFGRGDLSDLIPLQKEYNNTSTDIADIINYHGQPITVVKGAKSSNLEKGARKIWGGLPKDADIFNLELKSDLGASISYLNMIKTAIFEIGSMPEDALKGKEHVSNASGIALHVKNQPILDMTHKKWVTYGQGICDINRLILKTAVYLKLENFDIGAFQELPITVKYYTETIFADPLPKDILIQMQVLAQKLQLGLESRIGALKDLGEPDPAAKLGEIKDELQEMQDLVYDMGVASGNALETNVGGVVLRDEKVDPNINKDNVKEEGSQ